MRHDASYVPPAPAVKAFHCPSCGVFAHQLWGEITAQFLPGTSTQLKGWQNSKCSHCARPALWVDGRLVFPDTGSAPNPNPDLPEEIREDYEEARSIVNRSPRGAAALLRLAIQKLCRHLGEKGKNINDDIASLVAKGLPPWVQRALDAVRVIGNDAVHPGAMDLRDDPSTATALFKLVNIVAEKMLSEPREINEVYELLPQDKRDAIKKRDCKPPST